MLPVEHWIAGTLLASLAVYATTGLADFGGGIWDLLARGERARAQRETIAHAIAPIWEANHIWMIIAIVLLFTAFPPAFAAIATALHVPLTLMLLGIVLRGSAFTFRAYGEGGGGEERLWSRVFAVSSVATPLFLGVTIGAIASGRIRIDPHTRRVTTDFVSSWLAPFPFAIGGLTLLLSAFLAAVYLTLETEDERLRDDFRRRALASGIGVGVAAALAFHLAAQGAPAIREGLADRWWSLPFHLATGFFACAALLGLWTRRFRAARFFAVLQAAFLVLGWGFAQYPHLVLPDLTIADSAAPPSVLGPLRIALIAGALLVLPAFAALYGLFDKSRPFGRR